MTGQTSPHQRRRLGLEDQIHVERRGTDLFSGSCLGGAGGRVYGGQVAAQSLAAAGRTVGNASARPASLSVHFLAPGDVEQPVVYHVHRTKDGRSFTVRQVDAVQDGRTLAIVTATFHLPEQGPSHQTAVPERLGPAQCEALDIPAFGGVSPAFTPVEARQANPPVGTADEEMTPAIRLWLRARDRVSSDPLTQACALTWLSDLTLTRTVDRPRQHWSGFRQGASLDHSVWFHGPFDVSRWLLVDQVSDVYRGGRGLARGAFFDEAGVLVASSAQDCLIRRPESQPSQA